MNENKVYRVAIVGLGRMGSTIDKEMPPGTPPVSIAAACQASERLEVTTGADIDAAQRDAFHEQWGVAALYDDYLEMIRQEAPDIVAICTKGPLHAEMAVATAEAGVPMIYCEKAIACSMREADAVLEAVQSRGIPFNTGVLRRFDNRYHQARRLIERGEIGETRAAVHYAETNLLHGHIHSLDTLSFLLGDPKIVSVWGELTPRDIKINHNRLDQDPNAICHVLFENGVEGTSIPAGTWEFEVMGTDGSVRVLNNGEGLLLRQGVEGRKRDWQKVDLEAEAPTSPTLRALEDLIEAREEARPTLGNVELAYHLTEACIAVAESHILGRRVTLPVNNRDLYIFHR